MFEVAYYFVALALWVPLSLAVLKVLPKTLGPEDCLIAVLFGMVGAWVWPISLPLVGVTWLLWKIRGSGSE